MFDKLINPKDYPKHLIPGFSKFEIDFNSDGDVISTLYKEYQQQITKTEVIFDGWYDKVYHHEFQQVETFVNEAFRDGALFDDFGRIKAATYNMGWLESDHPTIIDKLEHHLKTSRRRLTICRISNRLTKRADLLNILKKLDSVKELLVILERAVDLEDNLLRTLVVGLYPLLNYKTKIAILFCTCMESGSILRRLGRDIRTNTVEFCATIINTSHNDANNLLFSTLYHDFRFAPNVDVFRFLDHSLVMSKSTIADLKYAYQYCLFKHSFKPLSVFSLKKGHMIKILEAHPELISQLKNLDSLKRDKSINWQSPKTVADSCEVRYGILRKNYISLADTMNCYFELLKDTLRLSYPSHLSDIYLDLMEFNNLAESTSFMDALDKLKNFQMDGIIKRLNKILSMQPKGNESSENIKNLYSILKTHMNKFENNLDNSKLLPPFIDALRKHASTVKNPSKLPLSELYYFDDIELILERLVNDTRSRQYAIPLEDDIISMPVGHDYYLKILYMLIMNSPQEIWEADLFSEFKDKVKLYRKSKRKTHSYENNEGFMKALYSELIDQLSHNGVIRRSLTKTRQGYLNRQIWHFIRD